MLQRVKERCTACHGSGHLYYLGRIYDCPRCNSLGYQVLEISFVTCSDCSGTGRQRDIPIYSCHTCRGTGTVTL